jgi:hypothetical protein
LPGKPGLSQPGGLRTKIYGQRTRKREKISNRRAAFMVFRTFLKIPVSVAFPIFYSGKSVFAGRAFGCQNDSFLNTRLPEMRQAVGAPAAAPWPPESTQVYATKASAAVRREEHLKIFRPPPDSPAARAGFFLPFYAAGTGLAGPAGFWFDGAEAPFGPAPARERPEVRKTLQRC